MAKPPMRVRLYPCFHWFGTAISASSAMITGYSWAQGGGTISAALMTFAAAWTLVLLVNGKSSIALMAAIGRAGVARVQAQERSALADAMLKQVRAEYEAINAEWAERAQAAEAAGGDLLEAAKAEFRLRADQLDERVRELELAHQMAEDAVKRHVLAVDEAEDSAQRLPTQRIWTRLPDGLTTAALVLAGPRRLYLRNAWLADLAGAPEEGVTLRRRARAWYATGFVVAAIKYRLSDMARPLWRPVDWVLAVDSRANGVIALGVGSLAIYIARHDGLHTLLTEGWAWCGGCGVALYGLIRWLRGVRGVELAAARQSPDNE